MAVTVDQVVKRVQYYDYTQDPVVLVDYDPDSPPAPMPSMELFVMAVSWPGMDTFYVPATWSTGDIEATIGSDLALFNAAVEAQSEALAALVELAG